MLILNFGLWNKKDTLFAFGSKFGIQNSKFSYRVVMLRLSAGQIRNVAIIAHSGAGKTSLTEAILFNAGVIDRIGSVENGNTTTGLRA